MCKMSLNPIVFSIALIYFSLPSFAPADCGSCGVGHAHPESQPHEAIGSCPVCGEAASAAHSLKVGSKTYYFASGDCKKEFRSRPLHYLKKMRMGRTKASVCPVAGKSGKCKAMSKAKCCGTCQKGKERMQKKSCGSCPFTGKKKCCGTCKKGSTKKGCTTSSCSSFKKRYFYE